MGPVPTQSDQGTVEVGQQFYDTLVGEGLEAFFPYTTSNYDPGAATRSVTAVTFASTSAMCIAALRSAATQIRK